MHVKAKAETGIVIRNTLGTSATGGEWGNSANAAHPEAVELIPSSTANCVDWFHAASSLADNAQKEQAAANYTTAATVSSLAEVSTNGGSFACYEFYLRLSAPTGDLDDGSKTVASVDVNSVTINTPTTQGSEHLNKAIRVGVVMSNSSNENGSLTGIFAPLTETANLSYKVGGSTGTSVTANTGTTAVKNSNITVMPYSETELKAFIYVWFEGEDSNCKSTNITASLDNLEVSIVFGFTDETE